VPGASIGIRPDGRARSHALTSTTMPGQRGLIGHRIGEPEERLDRGCQLYEFNVALYYLSLPRHGEKLLGLFYCVRYEQ
jgi:hypothetical protein